MGHLDVDDPPVLLSSPLDDPKWLIKGQPGGELDATVVVGIDGSVSDVGNRIQAGLRGTRIKPRAG